jgi:hypothetical protein
MTMIEKLKKILKERHESDGDNMFVWNAKEFESLRASLDVERDRLLYSMAIAVKDYARPGISKFHVSWLVYVDG